MFDFLPFYALICILLVVLWMWREDRHSFTKERQLLLDRIMSKNLTEYKAVTEIDEPDKEIEKDPTIIDLEDAKNDLMEESYG